MRDTASKAGFLALVACLILVGCQAESCAKAQTADATWMFLGCAQDLAATHATVLDDVIESCREAVILHQCGEL